MSSSVADIVDARIFLRESREACESARGCVLARGLAGTGGRDPQSVLATCGPPARSRGTSLAHSQLHSSPRLYHVRH